MCRWIMRRWVDSDVVRGGTGEIGSGDELSDCILYLEYIMKRYVML